MIINKIVNVNFNDKVISIISLTFIYYLIFEYKKSDTNIINIVLLYSILLLFSNSTLLRCLTNVFFVLLIVYLLNCLNDKMLIFILILMFLIFLLDMYTSIEICIKKHDPSLNINHIKKNTRCKKGYRINIFFAFIIILLISLTIK